MAEIFTKLYIVSNVKNIDEHFLKDLETHCLTAHVVKQLHPCKLVEEQFIIGFCKMGQVNIYPMHGLPDLNVYIKDSILSLDMSSSVYSGLGLAAKKIKLGKNRFFYRFRVDLANPKFQPDGPLHSRLRSFLKSLTDPQQCGLRVPRTQVSCCPYYVDWKPNPELFISSAMQQVPKPDSLAKYLNKHQHVCIRPECELFTYDGQTIHLPNLDRLSARVNNAELINSDFTNKHNDTTDRECAIILLSYLASGVCNLTSFNNSNFDQSVCENPSLTNPALSPIFTQLKSGIERPHYELHDPKILHLTGLFTKQQVDSIKKKLSAALVASHQPGLVFLAKSLLEFNCTQSTQPDVISHRNLNFGSGDLYINSGTTNEEQLTVIRF